MITDFVIYACDEYPNCKHLYTISQPIYPTGIIVHDEIEYEIKSISTHLEESKVIVWLREIK